MVSWLAYNLTFKIPLRCKASISELWQEKQLCKLTVTVQYQNCLYGGKKKAWHDYELQFVCIQLSNLTQDLHQLAGNIG